MVIGEVQSQQSGSWLSKDYGRVLSATSVSEAGDFSGCRARRGAY